MTTRKERKKRIKEKVLEGEGLKEPVLPIGMRIMQVLIILASLGVAMYVLLMVGFLMLLMVA